MDDKEKKNFKDKKFKKQRKERKPEEKKIDKICMNDPYWYVLHPELLKDVASLAYPNFMGRGFPIGNIYLANFSCPQSVVCKIPYLYMCGAADDSSDGINLAVRNLYTYIRHANSGHTNYESADLAMYLLGIAGVVATLAHLERIIGLAKFYQRRNALIPITLLNALGVTNVAALQSNLANYTYKLNVLWQRVSSLCIPKDFKFLQRWVWMNSQVFKDHESDKAVLYVFKPVGVPKYVPFASGSGGIIQQNNVETATPTLDDWYNDAEASLDALLIDEDMNIISGDILKAYGSENLLKFGMTPLDYIVQPVFVEEMLPQIQHLMSAPCQITTSGSVPDKVVTGINYKIAQAINDVTDNRYVLAQDATKFTIYQVDGEVVCSPCFTRGATSATIDSTTKALYWTPSSTWMRNWHTGYDRILNSYKESPTPEDNIIATRLMYTEFVDTSANGNGDAIYVDSCGTELVTTPVIYSTTFNSATVTGMVTTLEFGTEIFVGSGASAVENLASLFSKLAQIDWHPFIYKFNSTYLKYTGFYGEPDNFTSISPNLLQSMNDAAVLAEFNVSQLNFIK